MHDLAQSEVDGGRGLRLVLEAALGGNGTVADDLTDLCNVMVENERLAAMALVPEGAPRHSGSLPEGVQVWTRPQFVQAVANASFRNMRPHYET